MFIANAINHIMGGGSDSDQQRRSYNHQPNFDDSKNASKRSAAKTWKEAGIEQELGLGKESQIARKFRTANRGPGKPTQAAWMGLLSEQATKVANARKKPKGNTDKD